MKTQTFYKYSDLDPAKKTGVHEHNKGWFPGFLRAAGEELGWRSFLLPCLMTMFDPTMSMIIR